MADNNSQLTVLVKQADGTFVRKKLSELKSGKVQAPPVIASVAKQLVKPPIKNESVKKVSRSDLRSLLDEKLGKTDENAPLTSPKREGQIEDVLKKLNFSVPPDYTNRLRSVIQLRLKDLRSEDETRDTILRPIKNGGLGLTTNQAEKIIGVCAQVIAGEVKTSENIKPLVGKQKNNGIAAPASAKPQRDGSLRHSAETLRNDKALPMKEPEELPAVSAPFNSFVHSPKMQNTENVVSKIIQEDKKAEPIFKINNQPAVKKFVQDIKAPPMEMGPIDEIKYMTLTDFRRLSDKPEEAAKRLKQKLLNLQEESFLLYMEAVAAYHISPLYADYIQAVCASLANRRTLATVLASDRTKIQLPEVEALVEIEKEL